MNLAREGLDLLESFGPALAAVGLGYWLNNRVPPIRQDDASESRPPVATVTGNIVGRDVIVQSVHRHEHVNQHVHQHRGSHPTPAKAHGESGSEALVLLGTGTLAAAVGAIVLARELATAVWASVYVLALVTVVVGAQPSRVRRRQSLDLQSPFIPAVALLVAVAFGAAVFDHRVGSGTWQVARARLDAEGMIGAVLHGQAATEVLLSSYCAAGLIASAAAGAWLAGRWCWAISRHPQTRLGARPFGSLWGATILAALFAVGCTDLASSSLAQALHGLRS